MFLYKTKTIKSYKEMKNSCPEMYSTKSKRVRKSRAGAGHQMSSPAEAEIVVSLPTRGYFAWTTAMLTGHAGSLVGFDVILVSSEVYTLLSRVDLWGKERQHH